MLDRDYRDIVAGAVLICIGFFAAIESWQYYAMGTVSHMGPGMFPFALGFLLMVFGVIVLVPALSRPGGSIALDYKPLIAAVIGVAGFALTIDRFGMVPAIFALTFAAVFADLKLRPLEILLFATALSALSVGIFHFGLGIPVSTFSWPY